MTPTELIAAAESRLRDAENNLAGCVASLNIAKTRHGGVPNQDVVALAHCQAAVSMAYTSLALAKACQAPAPERAKASDG